MYTESTPAIADTRRPHAGKLSPASLLHQSDERLVSLARSGSERAWAEITRRYGRQLRAYCTRFVGPSRAEDAVQQTFLQAFLSLRDGTPREIALRAWLYRIAHNCSIDLLRKGVPDYDQLDLEYDGVAQPPTLFEQREEVRRLVARMRDLPDAQRQALALRELEGRSYEEISAQLGHSGSGVRQLIFRARTALRNSAPSILPLGFLKARLTQSVPMECHHVANAVAVPASSGSGVDAVGAATLAVVAVLGGGFAAADGGSRRARPTHDVPAGAAQSPVPSAGSIPAAPGAAPQARTGSGFSVRLPGRRAAGEDTTITAAAPLVSGPVAGVPPAALPPAAQDIGTVVTPAPGVQTPAGEDMRQQFDASAGASGRPAAPSAGAAPAGSPGGSTAPGTPAGTATAAPGAGMPAATPQSGPPGAGTTKGRTPVPAKAAPPPAPKPVKAQPLKAAPPKPQPPKPPKAQPPKAQPPKVAPPKAPAPRAQAPARKSERG